MGDTKQEPKKDDRTTEDYIRFISGSLNTISVSLLKLLDVQKEQNRILQRMHFDLRHISNRRTPVQTLPEGFELVPKKDCDKEEEK